MRKILRPLLKLSLPLSLILSILSRSEAGLLKRPLSFQQLTAQDGLSSEMVNAIAVQGEEVWFGTEGGGATLYDRSKKIYKAYTTKGEPMDKVDKGVSIRWQNLLPYNHVSVILPDVDRVWFGTYFYGFGGGGISYYQPQKSPSWKRFNTNDGRAKKVVSMAVDGEWVWVGSEKGLSLLDKKTEGWKRFYSTNDGLSGNFINSLLVQPSFLWAATNGGISRFDKVKKIWKTYSQKEGLTETEIKSLASVGQKIWAGGIGGTLSEYDPVLDRWNKIEPSDPLKNGGIYSIAMAKEKVFICRDSGISIYDLPTRQWDSLTIADGLLSNSVFCAAEDKNSIWFGTDKGASRLVLTP
ncbi:MAG TPA: two-component regulator propeller domain-containing protein [Thermodesulfobacteriota bacterium]|nr:two-component regulator propeller domain-containing protein [Thermodesulfobacteriota bacterium]